MLFAKLTARSVYVGTEFSANRRRDIMLFEVCRKLLNALCRAFAVALFGNVVERYEIYVAKHSGEKTAQFVCAFPCVVDAVNHRILKGNTPSRNADILTARTDKLVDSHFFATGIISARIF